MKLILVLFPVEQSQEEGREELAEEADQRKDREVYQEEQEKFQRQTIPVVC